MDLETASLHYNEVRENDLYYMRICTRVASEQSLKPYNILKPHVLFNSIHLPPLQSHLSSPNPALKTMFPSLVCPYI